MAAHRKPSRRRRLLIPFGGLLAALLAVGVAWAYWSTSGTGAATATTGTLNPPTSVTASANPGLGSAQVSWTASSGPLLPTGYYVLRFLGATSAPACGTSASSTTSATTCSDSSVPDGTYTYKVVAVYHSWTATSGSSNSVTTSSVRPAVTVNQASGQGDPTNGSPVKFTAVFSEAVTDFNASKVVLGGTAPGTLSASIAGAGPTYTISVSGMTGSGTVTASIAANTVHDANGAGNTASTSTDNVVTYDVTAPAAPTPGASAAVTSGSAPVYVNSEVVTFTDAATDALSGVASVKYYYCLASAGTCTSANGTLIGTSTNAGNGYSVASSAPFAASDGAYNVIAVVTDNAGNTQTSTAVQVAMDTTGPTVSAPIVNGKS